MTKIIGLTGGIGSGKTTIARHFMSWGVPVYFADDEAKKILFTPDAIREVRNAFGIDVFTEGMPDKKKIADVVFNDPLKLEVLNSIIHPKVKQHFQDWVAELENEAFVIKEAAILFESGSYKDCDGIILITAPKELRVQRVMQRDNVTESQVLERMANQWDDDKKKKLSNYIIENVNREQAKNDALAVFKIIQKTAYQI